MLREPRPLRTLAELDIDLDTPESIWSRETFDTKLEVFLRVWARVYTQQPELAAMSWVTEMVTLQAAHEALGNRVLWLCFDDLLADVSGVFRRLLQHYQNDDPDLDIRAIESHPLTENYSKSPGQRFNASVRLQILSDAHSRLGTEVGSGMKWLADAIREFPQLAGLPGTD